MTKKPDAKKLATPASWMPGQSGNPGGARKDRLFRQALIMRLKEKGDNLPELREIADQLIQEATNRASANFMPATKEIIDRLDGKTPVMVTADADEFRKATELTDDELTARIEDARRLLGLAGQIEGSSELH